MRKVALFLKRTTVTFFLTCVCNVIQYYSNDLFLLQKSDSKNLHCYKNILFKVLFF